VALKQLLVEFNSAIDAEITLIAALEEIGKPQESGID
jgi:hypothetical protein